MTSLHTADEEHNSSERALRCTRRRTERWERIGCDVHMGKDDQVEANSFQVALDGAKPVELDLCEVCDKELLGQLRELTGEVGQPVARSSTSGRRSAEAVQEVVPAVREDLTREGRRKHMMVAHSMERSAAGNSVREVFGGRTINLGSRSAPTAATSSTPPRVSVLTASNHSYVSPTKQQRNAAKAS